MKKLGILFLFGILLFSCSEKEDNKYTMNEISYNLYQGSDFDYRGTVWIKELVGGDLEMTLRLDGPKSDETYFFPAHLHFGAYDNIDAPIAFLLNPIDIRSLESTTQLGALSNGQTLSFQDFQSFDGHIKIHLADSGPEYQIILSVGNIGRNDNSIESFNLDKMTLCSPYY
ncbi:hypothetical protein [Cecembia sp.]|uniref:hypothetical protein n=1 Tax=Cecembia sp. TaxID=1898110 RepID=UPI0025B8A327|nr:hypothetical protein [Cecembia sp.]